MNLTRQFSTGILLTSLILSGIVSAQSVTPRLSYADSFSSNGVCYIDSNLDHGIGDVLVDTPRGRMTVRQVAAAMDAPPRGNNPLYNDVQCGNGPANNAGDEDPGVCPGRVDQGASGCSVIGPLWDLDAVFPTTTQADMIAASAAANETVSASEGPILTEGPGAREAIRSVFNGPVDCDRINGVLTCANYQLGSGAPAGVPQLSSLTPTSVPTPAPMPEPAPTPSPTPEPEPVPPVEVPPMIADAAFLFQGGNARQQLAAVFDGPVDCDRIGGILNCANYQLGSNAPAGVPTLAQLGGTVTTPQPSPQPSPQPTPPVTGTDVITVQVEDFVSSSVGSSTVHSWEVRSELGETGVQLLPVTRRTDDDRLRRNFNFWDFPDDNTPYLSYNINLEQGGTFLVETRILHRTTEDNGAHMWINGRWVLERIQWCRPNSWQYSSAIRLNSNPCGVQGTTVVTLPAGQSEIRLGAREDGLFADEFRFVRQTTSGMFVDNSSPTPAGVAPIPNDALYSDGDLLMLNYDHAPDQDDGHATVAGRMVVEYYGLRDSTLVISGAYGFSNANTYNPDSEIVSATTWGAEGTNETWWNADARRNTVVNVMASAMNSTLATGNRVWVLEGGQSDLTADAIRIVQQNAPDANLKNIFVIQHSHCGSNGCSSANRGGFNERNTQNANVNYIIDVANFVRIDNGNFGGNSTSDLNDQGGTAQRASDALLADPIYGSAWQAAFTYYDPVRFRLDFSDTVELLFVLGLDSGDIGDTEDFANFFAR